MTDEQYAEDLKKMIEADMQHLRQAARDGRNRDVESHSRALRYNRAELAKLKR